MIENEDGGVTGSIDNARLNELDPKTDEAKAQIDALKAAAAEGQEQTQADSERLNEGQVAANPTVEDVPKDDRDAQGVPVQESGEQQSAEQPAQQSATPEQPAQQSAEAQPGQTEQAQQEQARRGRSRGV